jgi:hypothetical protein
MTTNRFIKLVPFCTAGNHAGLSVAGSGRYLRYYPSDAAMNVVKRWNHGATITWEVNGSSCPIAIHFKKNEMETDAFKLKGHERQRLHFSVLTSPVGLASCERHRPQHIDENITADAITISIPDAFSFAARE